MAAGTAHPFADLVERNDIGRVVLAMEETIAASFIADKSRITQAEVKRRAEICRDIFGELRRDLKFNVDRVLQLLPKGLRCKLDGIPWKPEEERAIWSPSTSKVWLPS